MNSILVPGLINIETTLQVDGFPIDYSPVRYPFMGVSSTELFSVTFLQMADTISAGDEASPASG
jgi:hypothetical protein